MRIYACIITLVFCSVLAGRETWAQKTIHGTITDAESGEALPVAHIRIEGRLQGTISNSLGEYVLVIGQLPADISVTYIGYHSQHIRIAESTLDSLDIALSPNPVVLEEIVVTPDDPAVRIMREVIRRKQQWWKVLENWRADAYTRSSLANDERIALISESISNVYWKAGLGTKETIISKRQTRNIGIENNFAIARIIPNLYDDNIELLGFDIIGLTHPKALDYYDFRLTDQRMRDDRIVYDISVTPKKRLQPSFVGTLAVLDGEYAMIAVDVQPSEAVMFPPPLNNFDIGLHQQYDNFGGDPWLPVDVRISGMLSLKLPGLKFPPMNYRQMTRLTGYEINTALPDSIFEETVSTVEVSMGASGGSASIGVRATEVPVDEYRNQESPDRGSGTTESADVADATDEVTDDTAGAQADAVSVSPATDKPADAPQATDATSIPAQAKAATVDSIFAASPLVVPYDAEEERAYAEIDSTDNPGEAFRPTGFLANLIDDDDQEPREPKKPTAFGRTIDKITEPFSPRASFNRVDGAGIGLTFSRSVWRDIRFTATGIYRTELDDWAHGANLIWRWGNRRGTLGIDYGVGSEPRYRSVMYPEILTSVVSFAGGKDYYDYYHNERWGIHTAYDFRQYGTTVTVNYNDERHSPLGGTTNYALFGSRGTMRPNPMVPEAMLHSVMLSVEYGKSDASFGLVGERRVKFDVEVGAPDAFGGDYSFTRFGLQTDWRFETFLRRRFLPNVLDVRIIGGYNAGDTVPERFGILDGSLGAFGPFGVFRSLRNRPMEGKHYAAVLWEHNFRTVLFEAVGLRWFAEKGITIIMHGASGQTWRGESTNAEYDYIRDGVRHEVGLSVSGIFGLFRADVTKRLDRHGWFAGFGLARLF